MAAAFPLEVATRKHKWTAREVNSATHAVRHRTHWFSERFAVLVSMVFGHISHMNTTRALCLQFSTRKICVNTPCSWSHFQSNFNVAKMNNDIGIFLVPNPSCLFRTLISTRSQ
ncbi:hypothetical protein ISCGN_032947 [Ixodes scapularis]